MQTSFLALNNEMQLCLYGAHCVRCYAVQRGSSTWDYRSRLYVNTDRVDLGVFRGPAINPLWIRRDNCAIYA